MEIQTPYLDAIQAIPGGTPGEKYKWIAKLIKERISECNSLEEVTDSEKVPRLLAPIIRVQAARLLYKKDPKDQNLYAVIAEALKSDDITVVYKALQAKYFFDGSNVSFTNVQYFFNCLFPYVSLNTRTKIIKCLSTRLKEPKLAEEFFTAVAETYNLEQALPLLPACGEVFMYDTIVRRRIVLSRKLVKTIFHKNPDFIVRYFRLSLPSVQPNQRKIHRVELYEMGDFLAALIKKRLDTFVELYEKHGESRPHVKLSKKRAVYFLKNGKYHLLRNPQVFINLVPLKMISVSQIEVMFPKLFPSNAESFDTDSMLQYLSYYPQDKKLALLINSYHQVYGKSLLDDKKLVTADLMRLLPVEERRRQVKINWKKDDLMRVTTDSAHFWMCYLPTNEVIPVMKAEIAKNSEMEARAYLARHMIYSCRVNDDDQALLEVLTYIRDRHKNEQGWFTLDVLQALLDFYDMPRANEKIWSVVMDIILRAHVKNDLLSRRHSSVQIIEAALHFKILNNQPIDQLIAIMVDLKISRYGGVWNILQKYPEYERMCLEACLVEVSKRYNSDKTPWKDDRDGILHDLVASIYSFNKTHVTKTSRVEPRSIKNYPWLLQAVERIVSKNEDRNFYIIQNLGQTFEKNENDIFVRLYGTKKKDIVDIDSGAALRLLKNDPESISKNWKEYLNAFYANCWRKRTRHWVRLVRWHKDIPVRFLKQCLQDLANEQKGPSLDILALLVHGETIARILTPLIPTSKTLDIHDESAKDKFNLINHVVSSMKLANPPVPLSLLYKLSEGDYLSTGLTAMMNLCRRTNLMSVIGFAKKLSTERVSVRKHGVRVMYMVAPRDQLHDFILHQWKTDEHYSIQEILFAQASQMFAKESGPATWHLISEMIGTLTAKNENTINTVIKMIPNVCDEYLSDFLKLTLKALDRLQQGPHVYGRMLSNINPGVCHLLSEEFNEELLRRFLFNPETPISMAATAFALYSYLIPAAEKFESRMNTFTEVFVETIRSGWNAPCKDRSHFYSVNHALRRFIDQVYYVDIHGEKLSRLLNGILKAFLTVLTPLMDPTSYLGLVYMNEYASSKTLKEFAKRIGTKLPELLDIYTPMFHYFLANTLSKFLDNKSLIGDNKETSRLNVIEGLTEVGSPEATLIAVQLLTPVTSKENVHQYDSLVKIFFEYDHPAVKSIICDKRNKVSEGDFGFECM
ncbi:PREDICTED: uncharacterized protein LOC107191111 [Dufourea novaeangliae]|uniref:Uncharacterized protein n=1 Tax=Dufourea novaeangliae TaxID=178035 RepID=A0A154PME1_DUFNO|nr:PREDICTED: uncharacterized protein LOC107191111 [Dufourea novaeangliae]XP_015435552.1 PREDICTED: uncharacterized protein LOC107191111 [Dufourea novaeangliae]KZC13029.1 hypothetical protein WN55_04926 [Dufourea novaeangliae]